jgi:hypothetical protein
MNGKIVSIVGFLLLAVATFVGLMFIIANSLAKELEENKNVNLLKKYRNIAYLSIIGISIVYIYLAYRFNRKYFSESAISYLVGLILTFIFFKSLPKVE